MNRMRAPLVRKIVPLGIAVLLLCLPLQLAAQAKESSAVDQVSPIAWFASLWSDLTIWLADEPPPPTPEPPSESNGDNGCAIDPNGGCGS